MAPLSDWFGGKQPAPVLATAPAPEGQRPTITIGCVIEEFFVVRDALFVRGYVQRRFDQNPRISVRLWDGSLVPAPGKTDPVRPSDADRWSFHFSLGLSARPSAEEVAKVSLVFDFDDGRFELSNPAQAVQTQDKFLTSEEGFWAAVRAKPDARVLEVGSRARSGITRRDLFPSTCTYTGIDILAGENVDVVGDAHALSRHLPTDHFDFAFSISVWEHLAMPWLVSLELNKVLKTGGIAMIGTHQSWPIHETPWDYFRFSEYSWDALFNPATGFEIVTRGMGVPCVMAAAQFNPPIHNDAVEWHYGYLASRVVVKKISPTTLTWPVDPAVVGRGLYPH